MDARQQPRRCIGQDCRGREVRIRRRASRSPSSVTTACTGRCWDPATSRSAPTSRAPPPAIVERHYGDKVVAPWTSGTAGDQDPIYRVGNDFRNVTALGTILGEEIVRVADCIKTSPRGRIRAIAVGRNLPRERGPSRHPRPERNTSSRTPTLSRYGCRSWSSTTSPSRASPAKCSPTSACESKKEAPFNHTVVVTQCNGASGYLPDDAAVRPGELRDHRHPGQARLRRKLDRRRLPAADGRMLLGRARPWHAN